MLIKIIHPLTLLGLKIILPTKKQSCNNLLLGSHQLLKPQWLFTIISGSLQGSERPQISDIAHEQWCSSQHLCKFFQQDKGLILGNSPCFDLFVLWSLGPPVQDSHGQTCSTRCRGGSQMYLRDGTTLLWTQDERIGVFQPTLFRRRAWSGKELIAAFQYLKRLIRKTETLFPLPPPLSKFYCWAELMWYGISLWSVWVSCPSCVPFPRVQPTGEGEILERHPGCSRAQPSRSQSTGTLSIPF